MIIVAYCLFLMDELIMKMMISVSSNLVSAPDLLTLKKATLPLLESWTDHKGEALCHLLLLTVTVWFNMGLTGLPEIFYFLPSFLQLVSLLSFFACPKQWTQHVRNFHLNFEIAVFCLWCNCYCHMGGDVGDGCPLFGRGWFQLVSALVLDFMWMVLIMQTTWISVPEIHMHSCNCLKSVLMKKY